MTPTSLLGGIVTGLIDGAGIIILVLLGLWLTGKWHRGTPAVHPVADDQPHPRRPHTPEGELPRTE